MAVIPVEKISVIVHKSIKDSFLHTLQKEGIIHITELKETAPHTSEMLMRVNDTLGQLSVYKKRGVLGTFIKIKKPINFSDFEHTGHSYDYAETVTKFEGIKKDREKSEALLRNCNDDIVLLMPWIPLPYDMRELREFKETDALPCVIPSKEKEEILFQKIQDIAYSFEPINTIGSTSYYIFFVKKDQSSLLRSRLIENECDIVDFRDLHGKPAEVIAALKEKAQRLEKQINKLKNSETELFQEISKLEVAYDLITNEHKKDEVAENLPDTARTINIIGWIKKRDLKRLDALVHKAELAAYEKVKAEPDEKPPIALQNIALSQPYETLIKLYSMPQSKEYDPTPFLAFFFPLFFGLCLTDAAYGIALILFSLYLLKKVAGDRSLIWILFAGGIFTIFTGAIAGGWIGDLFDYIGFQPLINFRASFMLFDPLTNPMIFIGIALGLGFIHMLIGIGIEVVDSLKNGEYAQAIFANLTWLIFLPSLLLYFTLFKSSIPAKIIFEIVLWACIVGIIVGSHHEGKPRVIDQLVWAMIVWLLWYGFTSTALKLFGFQYQIYVPGYVYGALIPLIIIEIVRFREAKKALGKVAWGLYNLYGISSYLGVVLSYVRLMALGMVTGVIAIAINKIAWMITGIPVVGIFLVVIILIPGHIFNIIINALGGFIHTMRLQYIEFFGRFYTGGSKPFKPFGFETKYVEIE
jgi:V/A-type H+-transporting ATPase subunit I